MRAGRKARDEQKHTLGSCCSQQQVQRQGRRGLRSDGGGARAVLWKGEREHVKGGVGWG